MATEATDRLLSEFIDAWNAGRRPKVDDYVERAPEGERDELAVLIGTFLEVAPTPAYSPEQRAEIRRDPLVERISGLVESDEDCRVQKTIIDEYVRQTIGVTGNNIVRAAPVGDEAAVGANIRRVRWAVCGHARQKACADGAIGSGVKIIKINISGSIRIRSKHRVGGCVSEKPAIAAEPQPGMQRAQPGSNQTGRLSCKIGDPKLAGRCVGQARAVRTYADTGWTSD